MVSAAKGADDPLLSNPMTKKPMILIECETVVFEAYPAFDGSHRCNKGLYWEMWVQGANESFDEYFTDDVFDLIREAVGPEA